LPVLKRAVVIGQRAEAHSRFGQRLHRRGPRHALPGPPAPRPSTIRPSTWQERVFGTLREKPIRTHHAPTARQKRSFRRAGAVLARNVLSLSLTLRFERSARKRDARTLFRRGAPIATDLARIAEAEYAVALWMAAGEQRLRATAIARGEGGRRVDLVSVGGLRTQQTNKRGQALSWSF
jgi:hypothetical protein